MRWKQNGKFLRNTNFAVCLQKIFFVCHINVPRVYVCVCAVCTDGWFGNFWFCSLCTCTCYKFWLELIISKRFVLRIIETMLILQSAGWGYVFVCRYARFIIVLRFNFSLNFSLLCRLYHLGRYYKEPYKFIRVSWK